MLLFPPFISSNHSAFSKISPLLILGQRHVGLNVCVCRCVRWHHWGYRGEGSWKEKMFGVREKTETYLINYPAKHSCVRERTNAGLAQFYCRPSLRFSVSFALLHTHTYIYITSRVTYVKEVFTAYVVSYNISHFKWWFTTSDSTGNRKVNCFMAKRGKKMKWKRQLFFQYKYCRNNFQSKENRCQILFPVCSSSAETAQRTRSWTSGVYFCQSFISVRVGHSNERDFTSCGRNIEVVYLSKTNIEQSHCTFVLWN